MILPSVHLNGTGRTMLLDGYKEAYEKLQEFKDSFHTIEFNARDYYVQSPTAFSEARTQRDSQLNAVRRLMEYLEAHLTHLAE
jgi:hypothetical protein